MYCPKCGTETGEGDSFCQSCGAVLNRGVPSAVPSQGTMPSGPTQPTQPVGAGQPKVQNHIVWAIVSLIFFFLPTGIVAVVYSVKVDNLLGVGDIRGAQHASNVAKTWCIVSTAVFCFWIVVAVVFAIIGATIGLSLMF